MRPRVSYPGGKRNKERRGIIKKLWVKIKTCRRGEVDKQEKKYKRFEKEGVEGKEQELSKWLKSLRCCMYMWGSGESSNTITRIMSV